MSSETITLDVEVERKTGWKCDECEAVSEDQPDDPLYECGECGTKFAKSAGNGNRCECGKMGSRIGDEACPNCGAGNCEEIDVYTCPNCGEDVEPDEITDHLMDHLT